MTAYRVTVFHNTTKTTDGHTAIYARWGKEPRCQDGDTLRAVGQLEVTAPNPHDAAEAAFSAGNGAHIPLATATYESWAVRSLSAGDVVTVRETTAGDDDEPVTYACEGLGWRRLTIAPDTFQVEAWRQCSAGVGGDPADGCEEMATGEDGLCGPHRRAWRELIRTHRDAN